VTFLPVVGVVVAINSPFRTSEVYSLSWAQSTSRRVVELEKCHAVAGRSENKIVSGHDGSAVGDFAGPDAAHIPLTDTD